MGPERTYLRGRGQVPCNLKHKDIHSSKVKKEGEFCILAYKAFLCSLWIATCIYIYFQSLYSIKNCIANILNA